MGVDYYYYCYDSLLTIYLFIYLSIIARIMHMPETETETETTAKTGELLKPKYDTYDYDRPATHPIQLITSSLQTSIICIVLYWGIMSIHSCERDCITYSLTICLFI